MVGNETGRHRIGESGGESDHNFYAGLAQLVRAFLLQRKGRWFEPSILYLCSKILLALGSSLKGIMMKTIRFEADLLIDVINQFHVWKNDNDVEIYSVRQVYSVDEPCEMTVWYF